MHLPGGTFSERYEQDMAVVRTKTQWALLFAFLVLLFLLPLPQLGISTQYIRFVTTICITIVAVQGLNLLIGYTHQLSFGHIAFVAVGAYTSAILASKLGVPFWISLPLAGLVAGVVGVFFGLPSLRVKGLYLALSTLAAYFIIMYVISQWNSMTGGTSGIQVPPASLAGIVFDTPRTYYYIVLVVTIIMVFLAKNLVRTATGRAFMAIRDNDKAAEVMGISLFKYKLLAFFLGCFFAGISGALLANSVTIIDPSYFDLTTTILYVGMLIVGGMGSITGAIFGTVFLLGLNQGAFQLAPVIAKAVPAISAGIAASFSQMVYALVIILFLVFEPRGLYHRWELFKSYYRLWPLPY